MNDISFTTQSMEQVLNVYFYFIIWFNISSIPSIVIYAAYYKKRAVYKPIIINLFFYLLLLALYQLSIKLELNIYMFGSDKKQELWFVLSIAGTYILGTFLQFILFSKWLFKGLKILLGLKNLLFLVFVLLIFYPQQNYLINQVAYERILYKPDKFKIELLEGGYAVIDTACASSTFYSDETKQLTYNFRIPIRSEDSLRLRFDFGVLDKTNIAGASECGSPCKVLILNRIEDEIEVLFQQTIKKGDDWQRVIADTIVYKKVFSELREPGYYGDSNCDCIKHF